MIRLAGPALALAIAAACAPIATNWDDIEEFPIRVADRYVPPPADPEVVRVMSYNVKFGGARIDFFFDGWGDRSHMTHEEVVENLDALAELIRQQDPDVLLLQEVDVFSKRSAYIDQLDHLLEATDLNYGAYVPTWQVQYIPEHGFGRMDMGNATLSKYPILTNTRYNLPQSGDNSAVVNFFYLHRAIQRNEVDFGGSGRVDFLNNHTDAYGLDGTKKIHVQRAFDLSAEIVAGGGEVVVGGDLNIVPPGSLQLEGFEDVPPDLEGQGYGEVIYTVEETEQLLQFYDVYDAAIPLADYQAAETLEEQRRFFTHSIASHVFWTQKLDYLFTSLSWEAGFTLQQPGDGDPPLVADPMALSDHCPLVGDLVLR